MPRPQSFTDPDLSDKWLIDENEFTSTKVFALSGTEVGKTILPNSRKRLRLEADLLQHANAVNGLLVKYHDLHTNGFGTHILVMERIYPRDRRFYSPDDLTTMIDHAEKQLLELHEHGFAFHDFEQTRILGAWPSNVLVTEEGLRFVDVGVSVLQEDCGENHFKMHVDSDLKYLESLRYNLFRESGGTPGDFLDSNDDQTDPTRIIERKTRILRRPSDSP